MVDRAPTKPNRYAVYDENHNFIRYEYHERADEPTQVGDALNKANLLPDTVATALGLTGNPQVKDALERLSNAVNPLKYVWGKYTKAYQEYRATATERTLSTSSSPTQYQVYTSVSVNPETGVISGVGSVYTWAGTASYNCDAEGKYLNNADVWYFVVGMISLNGSNLIANSCSDVTVTTQAKEFIEQLASYSPTAYPQDGVLNDFYYKYIGRPQHIGAQIATGSYTGAGTYGVSNPNSLTAPFPPRLIVISAPGGVSNGTFNIAILTPMSMDATYRNYNFAVLGRGSVTNDDTMFSRKSGNTINWYASQGDVQMNSSGVVFNYMILG